MRSHPVEDKRPAGEIRDSGAAVCERLLGAHEPFAVRHLSRAGTVLDVWQRGRSVPRLARPALGCIPARGSGRINFCAPLESIVRATYEQGVRPVLPGIEQNGAECVASLTVGERSCRAAGKGAAVAAPDESSPPVSNADLESINKSPVGFLVKVATGHGSPPAAAIDYAQSLVENHGTSRRISAEHANAMCRDIAAWARRRHADT